MDKAIEDLVRAFAARSPAPAGGAAAALALSHGLALGLKVVRLSRTSRLGAEALDRLDEAEAELSRLLEASLPQFDEDCRAVPELLAYARGSGPREGLAPDRAVQVPFEILTLGGEALAVLERVTPLVKKSLVADAGAAAVLTWSAVQISHWNLAGNALWLAERRDWSETRRRANEIRDAAWRSCDGVASAVRESLGI